MCESLAVAVVQQTQSSLERDVLVKRCRESEEELKHMEVCWGGMQFALPATYAHLPVLKSEHKWLNVVLPCRVCVQI